MWMRGEDCCDSRFLYMRCCQTDRTPYVEHADPVRAHLRSRLRGSRFALVGDSLTRQWFETLACFLSLSTPTWFLTPPAGVPRTPGIFDASPLGFDQAAGYSIAGGASTVEYFHLDRFDTENFRDVLRYGRTLDFVVINFGLHYHPYRESDMQEYTNALRAAVHECRARNARCVFRETFPQHFPTRLGLYENGTHAGSCAPLRDPIAAFDAYNRPLHRIVGNDFPILATHEPMTSAWDQHHQRDCVRPTQIKPGATPPPDHQPHLSRHTAPC